MKLQSSATHIQSRALSTALDYARRYAYDANILKYGNFLTRDCTNFASQIVHEGWGKPTCSDWNYTSDANEWALRTWRVAQDFTEYWSNVRGYNGGLYMTRAEVNANANPGDVIAYMRRNTTEIFHVAFVQSKIDGYIYLTQHSPSFCETQFNVRVSESKMNNDYYVIVLNFSK